MRHLILISTGLLNLVHGLFHVLQFIQSILLVSYSSHHDGDILHNPYLSILWAIIGLLTLVIGVTEYIHHRRCRDSK
jgi:hypothetical protein